MAVSNQAPHELVHVPEAPYSTYQCTQCSVILSGLEPLDIVRLQTLGIGKCQ